MARIRSAPRMCAATALNGAALRRPSATTAPEMR